MNPVTEAEAERAIAELRAQRTALDRVRDTVAALAHSRIPTAMPANWSSGASRAYASRLHDIEAQLIVSESSLTDAVNAVVHDIGSVQSDVAASWEAGRMEGSR